MFVSVSVCASFFLVKFSAAATDNEFCALSSIMEPTISVGAACVRRVCVSMRNPCRILVVYLAQADSQPATPQSDNGT